MKLHSKTWCTFQFILFIYARQSNRFQFTKYILNLYAENRCFKVIKDGSLETKGLN